MEQFKIIYPQAALAPFVKYYWILKIDENSIITERTIPTGCVQLIFHRGKQIFSTQHNKLQPHAFISGQTVRHSDIISKGQLNMLVVVFQPFGAKEFLHTNINDFFEENISVEDISDKELKDLNSRISDTSDDIQCITLIEDFLLSRLHYINEYNLKRIRSVIQAINSKNEISVNNLADIACLSTKQFNRIFTEHIGSGPKEFIRIIRFQRALYTLQINPTISLTQLALECGCYDQSHLIKEFKSFSGYTPSEFITVCKPQSDYFGIAG